MVKFENRATGSMSDSSSQFLMCHCILHQQQYTDSSCV